MSGASLAGVVSMAAEGVGGVALVLPSDYEVATAVPTTESCYLAASNASTSAVGIRPRSLTS